MPTDDDTNIRGTAGGAFRNALNGDYNTRQVLYVYLFVYIYIYIYIDMWLNPSCLVYWSLGGFWCLSRRCGSFALFGFISRPSRRLCLLSDLVSCGWFWLGWMGWLALLALSISLWTGGYEKVESNLIEIPLVGSIGWWSTQLISVNYVNEQVVCV